MIQPLAVSSYRRLCYRTVVCVIVPSAIIHAIFRVYQIFDACSNSIQNQNRAWYVSKKYPCQCACTCTVRIE